MTTHHAFGTTLASCLVGLTLGATATVTSALDLGAVPLGASEAAVREAVPVENCGTAGAGNRVCTLAPEALPRRLGLDSAAAMFLQDRLAWLSLKLKATQFPTLLASLKAKFGQPSSHAVTEYRTKGGVEVANDIYTWRVGSQVVEARRFGESLAASVVHFRLPGTRVDGDGAPTAASSAEAAM